MANFPSWGPFELKISLGELANAVAIVLTGFLVARFVERRRANERATQDLIVKLCNDCLDHLSTLSQVIESECRAGQEVGTQGRNQIQRCLQKFSNAIHSVEKACQRLALGSVKGSLDELKGHRESLRTQITDPLAQNPTFDAAALRQIEGTILHARETVVDLEITVNVAKQSRRVLAK